MSRRSVLGLLLLAAMVVACQRPDLPRPSATKGPAALAAEALQSGDYIRAVELYRQALEQAPESVPLHYGLGTAFSFLNRKDDTIREFTWVLRRAAPGSAEAEAARQWLVAAGVLPRPSPVASPVQSEERKAGNASLEGRAVFAEAGQEAKPMQRMQLFLVGQPDSPTKLERYNLRTDENGSFKFPDVLPGPYKLVDRVAGMPTWRLRIELKPSEVKLLELTPANSLAARDDFPEQQAQAKE